MSFRLDLQFALRLRWEAMNLVNLSLSLTFVFLLQNEGCPLAEDVPQHYCGSRLSSALRAVCKSSGYASPFSTGQRNSSLNGVIQECCHNPCKRSVLRQYCQRQDAKPNGQNTQKASGTVKLGEKLKKRRRPRRCRCAVKNKTGAKSRRKKHSSSRMTPTTTPPSDTTTQLYDDPEVEYIDDWNGPFLSVHSYRMG